MFAIGTSAYLYGTTSVRSESRANEIGKKIAVALSEYGEKCEFHLVSSQMCIWMMEIVCVNEEDASITISRYIQ